MAVDAENPHGRVVLLLDMDCFYAQCEVVRLGLDRSIPLALMQVRSGPLFYYVNSLNVMLVYSYFMREFRYIAHMIHLWK